MGGLVPRAAALSAYQRNPFPGPFFTRTPENRFRRDRETGYGTRPGEPTALSRRRRRYTPYTGTCQVYLRADLRLSGAVQWPGSRGERGHTRAERPGMASCAAGPASAATRPLTAPEWPQDDGTPRIASSRRTGFGARSRRIPRPVLQGEPGLPRREGGGQSWLAEHCRCPGRCPRFRASGKCRRFRSGGIPGPRPAW